MAMKIIGIICAAFIFFATASFIVYDIGNPTFSDSIGDGVYAAYRSAKSASVAAAIASRPALEEIPIPVIGVSKRAIADSFGAARTGGRIHEGIDIFAPRGTYVIAATEGVVLRTGYGGLGGRYVYVSAAGGERFYYAHLDSIDPLIKAGTIVSTTTIIGKVGDTGNAAGLPTHLHFGIYSKGPKNPYPRLVDV